MFDLNPLDVLKERKLGFLPAHFSQITISNTLMFDSSVEHWINTRLKGRYCIVKTTAIDPETNKLKLTTVLGLEDQKEMMYFILAYPNLRR